MEFPLADILLALLFSSDEPLSSAQLQQVFARYHQQQAEAAAATADAAADAEETEPMPAPASDAEGGGSAQGVLGSMLAEVPALVTTAQIREALEGLADRLQAERSIFEVVATAEGYRLAIAPGYREWVRLLRGQPRPQRLGRAALEALAIVAYRQPVTRAELEAIRGVASDSAVRSLLDRELVRVAGRAELPGKPLLYATTKAFLDLCGLTSLDELPAADSLSPQQIDAFVRKALGPEELPGEKDMGLPEPA